MGGNALKIKTRRVNADEFKEIEKDIYEKLESIGIFSKVPKYFKNKSDFGDIDVLVLNEERLTEDVIYDLFRFTELVKNSNVWSFDYKGFQVDFIFCNSQEYSTSFFYFSYNDLGNLLGRLYHKLGMKFGHKGLLYPVKRGSANYGELVVTTNFKKILHFLGLSFDEYLAGFSSLEDIFKFVSKSKFFNPDIYLFENVNHRSRTRDKKRSTYNAFLKWCKTEPNLNHYQFSDNKSDFFPLFKEWFPSFVKELEILEQKIDRTEAFKRIYNGNLVMTLTSLEGKELGFFMNQFASFQGGKEKLMEQTLDKGLGWVKVEITKFFHTFKNE
jgi:hypothetical protein